MTLDEAIKHTEEMEEEQEELYRLCPASESIFHCDGTKNCKSLKNGENKGCLKCAEEYRQLAEWLKDYKRLLEQQPNEDAVSRQAVLDLFKYNNTKGDVWYGVKDLPSVTPKGKTDWILVSERLPKETGEYLVTILDYVSHEPYVSIVNWFDIDIGNNGFYASNKVVAWRKVPKPYKEASE